MLGFFFNQKFKKGNARRFVFCIFGNTTTRNIHMIAAVGLIGKDQSNSLSPLFLISLIAKFHIAVIIAIHDRNIAKPLKNCFGLTAIIALWFACQIVNNTACPASRGLAAFTT